VNLQYRYITAHCSNCLQFEKSVFCSLDHSQLNLLAEQKQGIFFSEETVILPLNEVPKGVYCLFDTPISSTSDLNQSQNTLLQTGQLIGYRSILSNTPTTQEISVPASTQLCYIPKSTFLGLAETNQSLAQKLITLLTEELKKAENQIIQHAKRPITERLIEHLLDQQTSPLSTESLLQATNTSNEAIERVLIELDELGLIQLQGDSILILDEQRLTEIANRSK